MGSSTAVVLGGNGQDGTYLVRALCARGRDVLSVGSQQAAKNTSGAQFRYASVDLRDRSALAGLLERERPAQIFHFAAVHKSSDGAPYEDRFGDMLDVNVASVHVALETLRAHGGRLLYASSIKAFGEPLPTRIDEQTPRRSSCLYSVTKNASTDLLHHYRNRHAVEASVVWLANHESPLRPSEFFIPKLAHCVANARPGTAPTAFYTLDFHCDWGSAEEYAGIAVDMVDQAPGEDFVLGTGLTTHARALAERLFGARGLQWNDYVEETHTEQAAGPHYEVVIDKLERHLGRRPIRTIDDVVGEIVAMFEQRGQLGNQP